MTKALKEIYLHLIEDNDDHAEIFLENAKILTHIHVTRSVNLQNAIEYLKINQTDIIVADLYLDDSEGIETIKQLKKNFPHLPIIVLSSVKELRFAEEAFEFGGEDYLVKSTLTPEILQRSIRYASARHHSMEAIRKISDELKQKNWLLESILQNMGEGVLVIDKDEKPVIWNRRAFELTSATVGKFSAALEKPQYEEGVFKVDRKTKLDTADLPHFRALRMGKEIQGECLFVVNKKFPQGRFFEVTSTPIKNEQGDVQLSVTVFRDVSNERMKTEKTIQGYIKELERSNEDLTSFAYVASHDLSEPLRKMSAYSDLLIDEHAQFLNEEGQSYIRILSKAARRAQDMVADLLQYSRLNQVTLTLEEVTFSKLISNVLKDLEVIIKESQASIKVIQSESKIFVDVKLFSRVLQNIIVNSIKYTKKDEDPQIEISMSIVDQYQVIVFADDGIGIDPQYHEKIFLPFYRLHSISEYSGTGIGLAICKKIIERHKGKITLDSKAGQGAKFIIAMPLKV